MTTTLRASALGCASAREYTLSDSGRPGPVTAREEARYVIVPIGLAGMPVGAYEAASGEPLIGALVAVVGVAAAALAIHKLTRD